MDNILFKDFNLRSKNMLITAKTRTGVTSSIMVPAILENNETNFVILDFNKEIYSITNKYRKKYSKGNLRKLRLQNDRSWKRCGYSKSGGYGNKRGCKTCRTFSTYDYHIACYEKDY